MTKGASAVAVDSRVCVWGGLGALERVHSVQVALSSARNLVYGLNRTGKKKMLENTDTLLTLAEIAAAFAGFAALVSVIGQRSDRPSDAVHDLLRLRLIIGTSVAGVAAALIPVGLAGYGLTVDLTYRLAALIFLIFDNGIIISFAGAYKPVKGTFPADRLAVLLVSLLELAEQISLFIVVLGLKPANASALYVTALIANICQAGFIFVRFVRSIFQHKARTVSD